MKRMKKILAVTLSLAMVLAFTACGGGNSGETIKIGFFAPVTAAAAAADGQSAKQSAELAVQLINEAGGINGQDVELVYYDDQLDTSQATSIAEKLTTSDEVVAVVSGSYSGPTRVAAPIIQAAGIPLVSAYAVHPEVVNAGDFVFSQSFPGQVQGTAGGEYATKELGAKRIAIVAVDLDFGTELAGAFKARAEANGAEIVSEDYIAITDSDMSAVVTKIKKENVDVIYMANYYAQAAEVAKQCAVQGVEAKLIGTEGADSWQFIETAGEYANGVILTTNMDRDAENEGTQKYITKYKETYDMDSDMVGASTYDAFQVLFAALKEVGTDPAALRDYIKGLTDFETVTGNLIKYTDNGEAVKAVQIQQVQDGAFHYLGVVDDLDIITPTKK
ncbi:MAG TPA: ABC transporter substrate-binding protein [Anaerovoracaceae bacterium]|nr:ABC transporter substrate-binding protein [Anaerovoracaceae bacterium]